MNDKKKGLNSKSKPNSKKRITGESVTYKQRYKKLTIEQQFSATQKAFYSDVFTMKTVSIMLGIDRANICRYVATLKKGELIAKVKTDLCPITKHRAGFYTTNPELMPTNNQLKLF
jgi:hypothetical protein